MEIGHVSDEVEGEQIACQEESEWMGIGLGGAANKATVLVVVTAMVTMAVFVAM